MTATSRASGGGFKSVGDHATLSIPLPWWARAGRMSCIVGLLAAPCVAQTELPALHAAGFNWSTFFHGEETGIKATYVRAVAERADGSIVIAGETNSKTLPMTPGAFDETYNGGTGDAFVACFSADGSQLIFSTYLGGSDYDHAMDMAVLASGDVVVAGRTSSANFPVTPGAHQSSLQFIDGFVARLDASGSALAWSTYIGGSEVDQIAAIAASGDDHWVAVGGLTTSPDFPMFPWSYDPTYDGNTPGLGGDAYIALFDADTGLLESSTFLGGVEPDSASDLVFDANGTLMVTGGTASPDFPITPEAYNSADTGGFVCRLSDHLSDLLASTYLGADVGPWSIALGLGGACTLAGTSDGPNAPTTPGAFDETWNGAFDGHIMQLDATLSHLLLGTYVGGEGLDRLYAMSIDSSGIVSFAGASNSEFLPSTKGSIQEHGTLGDLDDLFIGRLSPAGDELFYLTYLGGSSDDGMPSLPAVVIDGAANGDLFLGSRTTSIDWPVTSGAFDQTFGAGAPGIVARLDLLPIGVSRYGTATAGCSGVPTIGVESQPSLADGGFTLYATALPPFAHGALAAFSLAPAHGDLKLGGATLWIDVGGIVALAPMTGDAFGFGELPIHLADDPALLGLSAWAQVLFKDPCLGGGWQATTGLGLKIQP